MATLARARCFNHAHREAAGRCVACEHTYCRECLTEHAGRLMCSRCLGATAQAQAAAHGAGAWRGVFFGGLRLAVGIAIVAWVLQTAGRLVLMLPVEGFAP